MSDIQPQALRRGAALIREYTAHLLLTNDMATLAAKEPEKLQPFVDKINELSAAAKFLEEYATKS